MEKNKFITIVKKDNKKILKFYNGIVLGEICKEIDGYYVFLSNN